MHRILIIIVVGFCLSGCAGLIASRIVDAPPSRQSPFFLMLEQVDGELLSTLTAVDIQAVADDGVVLHATVIGPAARNFEGRTLDEPDRALLDDEDEEADVLEMLATFRGLGEVTHRFMRFDIRPADGTFPLRGTMLLLHGLSMDRWQMLPLALELADHGWQIVIIDLRGHGMSGGQTRTWGAQDGRDLTAIVDTLYEQDFATSPIVAVGLSYGAAAALHWARLDSRADAVVTLGAFADASSAIVHGARTVNPLLARIVGTRSLSAGVARAGARLGADLSDSDALSTAAGRLGSRLLIIHGTEDRIVPVDHAERLHTAAPCSTLLLKDGAGHMGLMLRQDEFVPQMLRWLDAVAPSEPQDAGHHLDCVAGDPDAVAVDHAP